MENEKNSALQKSKAKGFLGFKAAWNGVYVFFTTQTNARIHLLLAFLVVVMGIVFKISQTEWLIVCLCIGMVLSAEMMNTAIEFLTDLVSPGYNKKAGLVKDIAAGAVLVSAITAAIAGLWIFLPRLLLLIGIDSGID